MLSRKVVQLTVVDEKLRQEVFHVFLLGIQLQKLTVACFPLPGTDQLDMTCTYIYPGRDAWVCLRQKFM